MFNIIIIALTGIFRDRVFQGIMILAAFFCFIPSVASLSMRQVTELSITLSLSLITFILLLLSVFLGSTSLWKDIERRYSFSVVSLPVSRSSYIIGRFLGIALFLVLASLVLGAAACIVIKVSSAMYPTPDAKPLVWSYIIGAIFFSTLQYILLVAVAMLLSSVSTSFFLPVFGTISTYFASAVTQQVYEFVNSPASAKVVGSTLKVAANTVYYILPNLAGFDLKVNAIYSIQPSMDGLLLTIGYFIAYTSMLLGGACLLFRRREMK